MISFRLQEQHIDLSPGKRIMGFDLGTKRIGIAVSDGGLAVAAPVETRKRTKFTQDAEHIIALAQARNIGAFLYGLPVNMDGSEGPRCQSARQFARNMARLCPLPYLFWDERLSTSAVERFLIGDADASRARREQVVDQAAATYILQGALDAHRKQSGSQ